MDSSLTRLTDNSTLLIASLLMVDSLHFVFARALLPHLPPETSVFYVLGIATVEVAIFTLARGRVHWNVFRQNAWLFLAIGLLVAASSNLNYAAVEFLDPGTASLLGKTSVLFGLGFGLLWLRERLTALETMGAVVAILGAFVLSFQPGEYLRVGSLLVLGSALLYELHAALVKRYAAHIRLAEFFLFRLAATSGFLLLFAVTRGGLVWPGRGAWLIILLAGTVDVVISRSLYYLALRRLRISLLAIILTLSPVVTILWSLLLFGTMPAPKDLGGGLAVIGGIVIVMAGKSKVTGGRELTGAS